jgi:peptide/nickel transport system ATP-binding protein
MNELVRAEHLKKYFDTPGGKLHAVDDVSFTIREGETLGVVGESGCGKSTLGRVLIRLLDATDGKVFFDGEDITEIRGKHLFEVRRKMQIIFQDPFSSLNPRLSVHELIADPLKIYRACRGKAELSRRVRELMDLVGLAERFEYAYPHELDGGRRQRIGIARALALEPKFIVCDEPVSALDVSIQAQILNLLMDLQDERGLTYMFITHDLSVVKHISDEIMVMYLGQCVEIAPSKELFKNPVHPYTQALLAAIPIPDVSMRPKEIEVIKGELTSPINPKPGCRFASRCKYVTPKCTEGDLTLNDLGGGHFSTCVMHQN